MLGWATGPQFHLENLQVIDNVILRAGGCCDYDRKAPISMKLFGSERTARNIVFRNLDIEDLAAFGRWIDLQAGKATQSVVSDLRFEQIRVRQAWLFEGEVRGMSADNPVQGLVFQDVVLGETPLTDPASGQLSLIHTSGTLINGQPFRDVQPEAQPLPTPTRAQSTQRTSNATGTATGDTATGQSAPPNTSPASPGDIGTSPNQLSIGNFVHGLEGWVTPESGGRVEIIPTNDGSPLVAVTNRQDSSVGLECDVTETLLAMGPGHIRYGAFLRSRGAPVHLKVTLIVEDELGVQHHPSPDVRLEGDRWAAAARRQPVTWTELKSARLKIESGYGDRGDFEIREVFLRR